MYLDPQLPTSGTPDITFSREIFSADAQYGSCGSNRGGALNLAGTNLGFQEYGSFVRFKLSSEYGEGYVFGGYVREALEDGGQTRVTLGPGHELWSGGPYLTSGGSVLGYSQRLSRGLRLLGALTVSDARVGDSVEQVAQRAVETLLNSDFGLGADLYTVLGHPGAVNAVSASFVPRSFDDVQRQNKALQDYLTHWIGDPGDGWDKTGGGRTGIPPYLPYRLGQGSVDPATLSTVGSPINGALTVEGTAGFGAIWTLREGDSLGYIRNFSVPVSGPGGKLTGIEIVVKFSVTGVTMYTYPNSRQSVQGNARMRFYALDRTNGAAIVFTGPPVEFLRSTAGVQTYTLKVPDEVLTSTAGHSLDFKMVPQMDTNADQVQLVVSSINVSASYEVPNLSGARAPTGMASPFLSAAVYQVVAQGVWAVPPFVVPTLPSLSQRAAGASVHWEPSSCATTFSTSALPALGPRTPIRAIERT